MMAIYKKITGYKPSNTGEIFDFFDYPELFSAHSSLENGGLSSWTNNGQLNKQYPEIFGELCDFLLRSFGEKYSIMDMWVNITPPDSYIKPHHHLNSEFPNSFAGVYYLKKPKNSGNLFIEGNEIQIEEYDLVVFQGKRMHWTAPNKSLNNRIALSFNTN